MGITCLESGAWSLVDSQLRSSGHPWNGTQVGMCEPPPVSTLSSGSWGSGRELIWTGGFAAVATSVNAPTSRKSGMHTATLRYCSDQSRDPNSVPWSMPSHVNLSFPTMGQRAVFMAAPSRQTNSQSVTATVTTRCAQTRCHTPVPAKYVNTKMSWQKNLKSCFRQSCFSVHGSPTGYVEQYPGTATSRAAPATSQKL